MEIDSLGYPATIPNVLADWRARFASNILLLSREEGALTFAEADRASAQLAKALIERGVGKGSRVALLFPNGRDFVVAFLAVTRIGGLAIGINTLFKPAELAWQLRHCDAQLLIAASSYLNHDYVSRLEACFPELGGAVEPRALRLAAAPMLRAIVIAREAPAWATPLAGLQAEGVTVSDALLAGVEASVTPADLLCVIYTSGSSAEPKGVVHAHGPFLRRAASIGRDIGIRPGDVVFNYSPFFWAGGLSNGLFASILNGAAHMVEERFTPAGTLDWVEAVHPTVIGGLPFFAQQMARDPSFAVRDLSSFRCGGPLDILRPDPAKVDRGLWPTPTGMTETAGNYTFSPRGPLPEHLRGVSGPPVPGLEFKIVDPLTGKTLGEGQPGELCLRGYSLMQGYYKKEREETFDPDGFFHTGDLASLREGFHSHHGRLKDVIKASGANVSPAEVEWAIRSVVGVCDCHVVGLPDPVRGEVVAAVVVRADTSLDEATLRERLWRDLASYKVPRVIRFVETDDIPLLSTMKVDKRQLVARLQQALEEAV